jgi:hypothetical protein
MAKMKMDIKSEWEVTDLGEPTKIVGIEITRKGDTITITQEEYIEAVFKERGNGTCEPSSDAIRPTRAAGTEPRRK